MHGLFRQSINPDKASGSIHFNFDPRRSIRSSIFPQVTKGSVTRETSLLEKRLTEAFNVFDNANCGEVDVRDLGTIIRSLGCVITETELQEIQVELEDVENNSVSLERFIDYMVKAITERKYRPAEPEDLLKAFHLLDIEKRGYVMREDLEKIITQVGEPLTEQEVTDMMSIACDPKSRKINYENYINLLIVKIPQNLDVYCIADLIDKEREKNKPKQTLFENLLLKS